MVRTYETKSTRDFSAWFIFLRIIGNSIWISYSINIDSLQMLINNCVTVSASLFISYYKCRELYADYNEHKNIYSANKYKTLDDDTLLENGLLQNSEEQIKHREDNV